MTTNEFLQHRPMLYGLAYRLLGSVHDAQDVLQEAYLRWTGADRTAVAEPRRYLTRVVARLAVDQLRARQARRESYVGEWLPEPVATDPSPFGTVDTSDLSIAMLHLMEQLTAPQRAVFVLRTAFGVPYEEIATVLARGADDCRQLYHRADQALRDGRTRYPADPAAHRKLLADFVAAAREGDLTRLHKMLHADVIAWSDGGGRTRAARRPIRTVPKVARFFGSIYGRPQVMRVAPIELNGTPAAFVSSPRSRHLLLLAADADAILGTYLVANPESFTASHAVFLTPGFLTSGDEDCGDDLSGSEVAAFLQEHGDEMRAPGPPRARTHLTSTGCAGPRWSSGRSTTVTESPARSTGRQA